MIAMLRKDRGGLWAGDEASARVLAGIKAGEVIACEIKRPRNLQMHRLFWALCQKVYENQETYPNAEAVAAAIKVATGHCDWIQTPRGLVGLPRSISFAKFSQEDFRDFLDKAIDYIVTHIIPGLNSVELEREVNDMLAVKVPA